MKVFITMALLSLLPLLGFGQPTEPPFDYDLHLSSFPGNNERTMICFHGYGGSYEIAASLRNQQLIGATLISFNFPEYGIMQGIAYNPNTATFGTIDELLPALYVLKQVVLDQELVSIDLYGFSAGGAAVVNVIRVLNTTSYDTQLQQLGIGSNEKEQLLAAIQKGVVILDTPLKSIEEIIAFRGSTEELDVLAQKYTENDFRPIDSVARLQGLSLDIIVHFQEHDEILSNRDDALYVERLRAAQENVAVVVGDDGGHTAPHPSLWRFYAQKLGNH